MDWSFSEVVRDRNLLTVLAGAIEDMEHHIKEAVLLGISDPETLRERIPLDTVPFKFAKKMQIKIQDMAKDDEIRISFQALFLFVLRPYIPIKCDTVFSNSISIVLTYCLCVYVFLTCIDKTCDEFLEKYPDFKERGSSEQDRLRNSANWMDLSFYTIQPRNNKTFILNLIPRVVEGRNARYITGSGQTKPTTDRVNLFRWEGNCEKIKRPPRRKKEEIMNAAAAAAHSVNAGSGSSTIPVPSPNNPATAVKIMVMRSFPSSFFSINRMLSVYRNKQL